MENKYRVNFQVDTGIPIEFFFVFFVPCLPKDIRLSDITITFMMDYSKSRSLENGDAWNDKYRFISFFQSLRDNPFPSDTSNLSDKEFVNLMSTRFAKADRMTFEKITTLFKPNPNRENIVKVYDDFRVKVSIKGKEEGHWISVPVGYCVVPVIHGRGF